MNLEQYKEEMWKISQRYAKKYRGAKYVKQWDKFWNEKQLVADLSLEGRDDIKSVLDIGTGVGMLPFIYQQRGIEVEGTDITEDITGKMFIDCCNLINMKRFELWVRPNQPMNLSRHYDMIVATRTEFDRQEGWNWKYFLDDCFKHCNRVFFKLNEGGSIRKYDPGFAKILFNKKPDGTPIGHWCLKLDKEEWLKSREDIDVT